MNLNFSKKVNSIYLVSFNRHFVLKCRFLLLTKKATWKKQSICNRFLMRSISAKLWKTLSITSFATEISAWMCVVEYCYKDAEKKSKRTQFEIDFVAKKGSKKYYIQSVLTVADEEKR